MKLTKAHVLVMLFLPLSGLAACSTVDLSQVALSKPEAEPAAPRQSVVERAATRMTKTFEAKGWCDKVEDDKTARFASVLVNGLPTKPEPEATSVRSPAALKQLRRDIYLASRHIDQTTKAAEVFLSVNSRADELEHELGGLETALSVARQAETRFKARAGAELSASLSRDFTRLDAHIQRLQNVTDAYGRAVRLAIAARKSGAKT